MLALLWSTLASERHCWPPRGVSSWLSSHWNGHTSLTLSQPQRHSPSALLLLGSASPSVSLGALDLGAAFLLSLPGSPSSSPRPGSQWDHVTFTYLPDVPFLQLPLISRLLSARCPKNDQNCLPRFLPGRGSAVDRALSYFCSHTSQENTPELLIHSLSFLRT